MPRRLKVFETHIGFYDMVVAAPSMKAAAEAWGAKAHIFAQGFARQTKEQAAVTAALEHPGEVLKRPYGTKGAFQAEPAAIPSPRNTPRQKRKSDKVKKERKHKEAQEARAQVQAARKERRKAKDELAAIESEEAQLRERRQNLRRKFHLHTIRTASKD